MTVYDVPTIPDHVLTLWDRHDREWRRSGSVTWWCGEEELSYIALIARFGPLTEGECAR
jgi:hypothetical protein